MGGWKETWGLRVERDMGVERGEEGEGEERENKQNSRVIKKWQNSQRTEAECGNET